MLQNTKLINVLLFFCLILYIQCGCMPGEFPFLKRCLKCRRGEYCPDGISRNRCPPGTYASNEGSISCDWCLPGTTSIYGSSRCSPCAPGTFAPDYGSSRCYKCPDDSTSGIGATACERVNYYYDYHDYQNNYQYDYF